MSNKAVKRSTLKSHRSKKPYDRRTPRSSKKVAKESFKSLAKKDLSDQDSDDGHDTLESTHVDDMTADRANSDAETSDDEAPESVGLADAKEKAVFRLHSQQKLFMKYDCMRSLDIQDLIFELALWERKRERGSKEPRRIRKERLS
jgi:hypothetical protein